MKLRPIDDRVVIEKIEKEQKKIGNVYLPESAVKAKKKKLRVGVIIAIGMDKDLQRIVSIGDKVVYAKWGYEEIKIEDKELLILSRDDILAIIEEIPDEIEFEERSKGIPKMNAG